MDTSQNPALSVDTNATGAQTRPTRRESFAQRLSHAVRKTSISAPSSPMFTTSQSVGGGSNMFSALQTVGADNDLSLSLDINDYLVHHPIGYGSSAVVYLATYKPLKKQVAIKMLDLDMFERDQIEELRRELQIMTLSKHPNILPVHGAFVSGSKLYIIMPYMASGSCLDILRTSHAEGLEETIIATILKQALLGLDYLHRNGHIHRDVKAGNMVVDEDGTVQLADFGVSSSLMEGGDRKKKRRTFVGTPCWMAPEVLAPEHGYDYKADIWSFGITALELAMGHAPYAKYPPLKVLMLTLSRDPPALHRDSGKFKYSRAMKEMIDSCLQKDPTKRPTAEKLLQHSFFKQAKKPEYLVRSLLQDLPPVNVRPLRKPTTHAKPVVTADNWDFSIGGSESSPQPGSSPDGSITSDNTRGELQSVDEETSSQTSSSEATITTTAQRDKQSDRPRRRTIGASSPVRRGRFHVHTGSLDLGSMTRSMSTSSNPFDTQMNANARTSVDVGSVPVAAQAVTAEGIQSRKGRFDLLHMDDGMKQRKASRARVRFASVSSEASLASTTTTPELEPAGEARICQQIDELLVSGEQRQLQLENLARDVDNCLPVSSASVDTESMSRRSTLSPTGGSPSSFFGRRASASAIAEAPLRQRSQSIDMFIRDNEMLRRENQALEEENSKLRAKLLLVPRPGDSESSSESSS